MNKIRSARFRLLTQSTSPWQVCVLMLFCIDTAIYTLCIHIATSFMNLVDRLIISLRTNIVVPKTFIGMNHHWIRNYTASKASFYHPIEIFQMELDSILQLRWWKTAWHLAVKEMSFILVQHVLPAAWCLDRQELLVTHSSWDVQKGLPATKFRYTSKIGTDNPISLKSLSFCWSHQSYSWQNVWLGTARNVSIKPDG